MEDIWHIGSLTCPVAYLGNFILCLENDRLLLLGRQIWTTHREKPDHLLQQTLRKSNNLVSLLYPVYEQTKRNV